MMPSNKNHAVHTEVFRSPALYLKELEVTEDIDISKRSFFSGTRLKAMATPFLYWILQHAPTSIAVIPIRLILWLVRILYWWPGNPLRLSCEYVCQLASRQGYHHNPKQVYRQFIKNSLNTVENYFQLYRKGVDEVLDRIEISQNDIDKVKNLVDEHGGVILAVPHNLGSAFAGIKFNRVFPLVLVARNPPTIARTKASLDFYERMEVSILLVRGGNPFELSRTLFSVLKSKKVVAATIDSLDHSEYGAQVHMFGQKIGLVSWAAKIASKKSVPIVPTYTKSIGRRVVSTFGEPIVTTEVNQAAQHYASYFERGILEDPASWAFIGDKRWHRVLRQAARIKDA